jgi:hypothetical protein
LFGTKEAAGNISKQWQLRAVLLEEPENEALFSFKKKIQIFSDFSSHQILQHIHGAINIY